MEKKLLLLHGLLRTQEYISPLHTYLLENTPYEVEYLGKPHEVNVWIRQKGKIEEKVKRMSEDGKIAIVGHSLGGFHGAEVAFENPDKVDEIITLFSPVRMLRKKPDEVQAIAIYSNLDPIVKYGMSFNRHFDRNFAVSTIDHSAPLFDARIHKLIKDNLRNAQ